MKTRLMVFAGLLLCLVGCIDSPDSVAREYRNAINECMDALMFITDDASAHRMALRVLKPMETRFRVLEKKLQNVHLNRAKKEDFVKEVFESDGVHLYLSELQVNRQRYALERTRLRLLYRQIYDKKREELDSQGLEDEKVEMEKECPALHGLLEPGGLMEPLGQQVHEGEFGKFINQFPTWKVKDYDKLYGEFRKKREPGGAFEPKGIKLVY